MVFSTNSCLDLVPVKDSEQVGHLTGVDVVLLCASLPRHGQRLSPGPARLQRRLLLLVFLPFRLLSGALAKK